MASEAPWLGNSALKKLISPPATCMTTYGSLVIAILGGADIGYAEHQLLLFAEVAVI